MVRLVRAAWLELNSLCVIAGSPVEGVVREWALVSGLQRGDVALDGRSGAVRTFCYGSSAEDKHRFGIVLGYWWMCGSVTSRFLYMLFR